MWKIVLLLLKIFVSGTFISSALAKYFDFFATARYMASLFHITEMPAIIALAILIGIEAVVAAIVLYGLQNMFVYKSIVALILIFAIVNVLLILVGVPNCGCMGTTMSSPPSVSLLKNIFLMIAIYIVHTHEQKSVSRL